MNRNRLLVAVVLTTSLIVTGCPGSELPQTTVPNVVGLTESGARSALLSAVLRVGDITLQFSEVVPLGVVISQSISPGTVIAQNVEISLVVSRSPSSVSVPNLTGLTQSGAEATLSASGLAVGSVTQAFSNTVPAGQVISQTPASGTLVTGGTNVSFVVSQGPPPPVSVPNVVGMSRTEAESAITGAGLSVGNVTEEFSSTVPAGLVISQNPSSGTSVSASTAVNLVISRGPSPLVTVPNLVGTTRAAAEAALAGVGLLVGTVNEEYSAIVLAGHVIRQNPSAGAQVNPNNVVAFTVSLGPEPIEIDTLTELESIGKHPNFPLNANYLLTADINAAAAATSNGGLGFEPIGRALSRFTGAFDGQGHAISGLIINRPEENYVGLFGYLGPGALVKNLLLPSVVVNGDEHVGGLAGRVDGARVENCEVSGAIVGWQYAGGLAGSTNLSAIVQDSIVDVDVTGSYASAGGLIGNNAGSVSRCESLGTVTGDYSVGGLAGVNNGESTYRSTSSCIVNGRESSVGGLFDWNYGAVIQCGASGDVISSRGFSVGGLIGTHRGLVAECYALGNVGSDTERTFGEVGGLVGNNLSGSVISSSFATGTVIGTSYLGGLVGNNESNSTVSQSYSIGPVFSLTGSTQIGGLVGRNAGTVSNAFWDRQTSGLTESAGGTGLNTVQMLTAAQFIGAGWDFVAIWDITEGVTYPFLRWTVEE